MTGQGGGSRKPRNQIAAPDTERNNPAYWEEVGRLAREATKQADNRKDRRYWKRAAVHAERQAAMLRLGEG